MDFPHGRHHHHHHHSGPEEEAYPPPSRPHPPPYYENEPPPPVVPPHPSPFYENEPPPPVVRPYPSPYYENEPPPPVVRPHPSPYYENEPPPQVTHVYHSSSYAEAGPEGPYRQPSHTGSDYGHGPQPSFSAVEHVSHQFHHPHLPSFFHHNTPHSEIANRPYFRVYSKAEPNYSLTIRDGKVILARSNPSDPFQHWIKDEKYSTKVKDEEGFPSFALVNKATGQAIKHSIGATKPVQLIAYNPDVLDESILWTESKDLGDTFRTVRMVNNIRLNVDAFNGDKNHGGVHEGTIIVLWEWKKGDNQRWKIVPY